MSKKSGKLNLKKLQALVQDEDLDDEFDLEFADDFELESDGAMQNEFRDDWDEDDDLDRFSARRRIERRRDMKKVYTDLDEWEQFGADNNW